MGCCSSNALGAEYEQIKGDGEKGEKIENERRASCIWRLFCLLSLVLLLTVFAMSVLLHAPGLLGAYGHSAQRFLHETSERAGYPLENITVRAIARVCYSCLFLIMAATITIIVRCAFFNSSGIQTSLESSCFPRSTHGPIIFV